MRKVQHWVAGWNVGGYCPDPDMVLHGATLREALVYLREALERDRDECESGEQVAAEAIEAAIIEVDRTGEDTSELVKDAELRRGDRGHWSAHAGPFEYWIMPCFARRCNDIDEELRD